MLKDWGAIFWPEVAETRYGRVVPAEGAIIANRGILLAAATALATRALFSGEVGSKGAWLAFPVAYMLVLWWGRSYYRGRGARIPRRVLVVEDDPATAGLLDRVLRRRGWDVDLASTVAEGKEYLARDPAVVVLDVRLPDGSGLDLFRYMRKGSLAPRTLVMTASSDAAILAEVCSMRPSAVIHKPIDNVAAFLDAAGEP